jgi:hypothetical protein
MRLDEVHPAYCPILLMLSLGGIGVALLMGPGVTNQSSAGADIGMREIHGSWASPNENRRACADHEKPITGGTEGRRTTEEAAAHAREQL